MKGCFAFTKQPGFNFLACRQLFEMRLDKFLKVSRLIKRRSVANEACASSHVSVNGRPAKPSKDVQAGDIVEIVFGNKTLKFEILKVAEFSTKEKAEEMYKVIL